MHRDWLKVNCGFLPPQRGNSRRYIGTKQGYHLNYRHLTILSNTNPRESSLVENRALLGTLCLSRLEQASPEPCTAQHGLDASCIIKSGCTNQRGTSSEEMNVRTSLASVVSLFGAYGLRLPRLL